MKTIFLISFLLGFGILFTYSQDSIVSIPDAAFLNALIENGVDKNGDGKISLQEAENVHYLSVVEKGITDLTGLEAFVNIDTFDCSWNSLNSLDVSSNTALMALACRRNHIASLDVSNNIALTELECSFNQLTSLDVSSNTALMTLACYWNQITSLDVSNNNALMELGCSFNQLTSLDFSNNTNLTELTCDRNQLSSLNVKGCKKLEYINCGCARCVEWGAVETNQLTSLDLSNNTKLISIDLSGMASLGEVCVWEGFDDGIAEIVESLNVYFTTECSGSTDINDQFKRKLTIYPNPTHNLISIESCTSDLCKIEVKSSNGQLLISREMEGTTHQLDLSSFQDGVYFITIESGNAVLTRKIIKL